MSSCKRCYLLRALTFHSKLEKPNESIHGRVKFLKCVLPHVSGIFSLPPPHLASSPKIVTFFLPRMFPPLLAMSSHIHCPTARPQCFTPCIPLVPSLHWFINVCSRTFLSFILKALRLLRNCCLCQVCTARAMPAVENISCNPSASSSEGRRSSCCSIAAPQKQPGYSVAA